MMSLWTLFVVTIFGSFWSAVIGLSLMMYVIMVLGDTSQETCFTVIYVFILILSIGYGSILISIALTIGFIFFNMLILPRIINRASQ